QVASDVYVTDEQLWRRFQDQHDSAQTSFVAFDPDRISDSAVRLSDDEVRAYYDTHKKLFDRPGTAKVSIIIIPRAVRAADAAAARTGRRADSLARIAASSDQPSKFDDAARTLHIPVIKSSVVEGNAVTVNGQFIPSVGPWAFQGARPDETSELFDAEDGYYL